MTTSGARFGNAAGIINGANGSANDYTNLPQRVVQPFDQFGDPLAFDTSAPSKFVGGGYGSYCGSTESGWYCWGANDEGQAAVQLPVQGTPTLPFEDQVSPYPAEPSLANASMLVLGSNHSCAANPSGTPGLLALECFGADTYSQLGDDGTAASWQPVSVRQYTAIPGFTSVAVGLNHSCAIVGGSYTSSSFEGNVACWGQNQDWQTGAFTGGQPDYLTYD